VSFSALQNLARLDDARASPLRRLISLAALQCLGTVSPSKFTPEATGCATDAAVLISKKAPDELPGFLAGLDMQLMAQEAQAAFDERATTHLTVHRVFWREAGQVLVEFDDGVFGLLVKLKGRWRVFTGRRDDVLANVPDTSFADAAAGLFGDTADEPMACSRQKTAGRTGWLA
jgi:hypothetical protein